MTTLQSKRVIGVRFRRAGPLTYYDPGREAFEAGESVVVDTPIGPDLGTVVLASGPLIQRDPMVAVRPVVRRATADDLAQRSALRQREAEALVLAKAKARNLGMRMKISAARWALNGRKLVLEFTAEERLDLRPLYRSLSEALRARVELKAIGARDETKNLGGIGRCGLELCCTTWLATFESVSVRMAKEQALPISAEGLAGVCGRLRCCLRYEYEQYRAANRLLPRIGERVITPDGPARVIVGSPLKETVSVVLDRTDSDELARTMEYPVTAIRRSDGPAGAGGA